MDTNYAQQSVGTNPLLGQQGGTSAIPGLQGMGTGQLSLPSGQQQTPAPQTQQTQGKQPSWWEKLLPTAGGILGGIGGEALDVFGGGIAGAAAGGALGQKLENMLTGGKQSTLAAGAENAIGSGVGGVIGKGLSSLAGKVVAPLAETGASKLVAGQAPGVTKDLAEYILKDNGITDLAKAGQFADVLTGGAKGASADIEGKSILNKYMEDTLANQGPKAVQISDIAMNPLTGRNAIVGESIAGQTNALQKSIESNSLKGTPEANAIRTKISGILGGIGQDVSGNAEPLGALDAQRQIASLASDSMDKYIEGGRTNITLKNMAQTYSDMSNILKERLGLHNIAVSPEDAQALAKDVLRYGSPISKSAAQNVANELQTEGLTLGGIRNLQSNWVQIKSALQNAADLANKNFGATTGDLARSSLPVAGAVAGVGGPKSLLGTVGGLATSSSAADKTGAGILNTIASGAKGKIAQDILPLAARASTIAAANVPNMAQNNANINAGTPTMNNNQLPATGGAITPYNNLLNAMMTESVLAPNLAGSSGAGTFLNTLAPSLQKAAMGQQQLSGLEQQFGAAGGAQGMGGGGILDAILARIPGTAQQAAASQAGQLTSSLGLAPGMAPNFLQTPGVAGTQLSTLQSILNAMGGSAPAASSVPVQ